MADTKKERARKKYEQQHGSPPPDNTALTAYMATLSISDYQGCSDESRGGCAPVETTNVWDAGSNSGSDYGSSGSSSDSGASSSSSDSSGGSSCGGGGCGGGGG